MTRSRTPDEDKLCRRVEALTGGRVLSIERQWRHRPAWFVDVVRGGERLGVYVRGDRQSDVQPFPELRREADILEILEQHGIPVPHVYGMCEDPKAILMAVIPGTRDVSKAPNDAARRSVARQYIETLVALHRIPLEPFVAKGLRRPVGAEQIALAGLDAYMPLYLRHKARPEPLLEFAIAWLKANVPMHRARASFVAFDAGQFLFDAGKLTAIFDLEYALIGDPLADLASMALREPIEAMGDGISELCQAYAALVGEPLDVPAIRYHQVVFSTVACMQFAGAVARPERGDPHDVYLGWWLYLRRCLIQTLSACIDVEIDFESLEAEARAYAGVARKRTPLVAMLEDSIRQIPADSEPVKAARRRAQSLVAYLAEVERYAPEVDRLACEEALPLVGDACRDRGELDARLEKRVAGSGRESYALLLRFFARDVERQRLAYRASPLGQSADYARLVPI